MQPDSSKKHSQNEFTDLIYSFLYFCYNQMRNIIFFSILIDILIQKKASASG